MVSQELVDYIEQEELEGYSKEKLETALVDAGWDEDQVEQALAFVDREIEQAVHGEERPRSMTVLSLIYYVLGGLGMIAGSTVLLFGEAMLGPSSDYAMTIGSVLLTVHIATAVTGWGVWNQHAWSWYAALVLSFLGCMTVVGVPFGAVFLYLLYRHRNSFR
jgi:hypothetical protein